MAIYLHHDHTRRRVIGWVVFLILVGVSMAASGSLDWPLLDAAQPVLPADFRQGATNVIFNLWFLASSVTGFALLQQAWQRYPQSRPGAPEEGSLTRREFLLVAGGVTVAATGLVGIVRLIRDGIAGSAEETTSTASSEIVPVENALPAAGEMSGVATAVPASDASFAASASTTTTAQTVATGRRLCDRGCSYPGHCGRYQDSNGNSTCDLTEAIW